VSPVVKHGRYGSRTVRRGVSRSAAVVTTAACVTASRCAKPLLSRVLARTCDTHKVTHEAAPLACVEWSSASGCVGLGWACIEH
jgi:hypothetical protein